MARTLGWRPDLYRKQHCAWCRVRLATCGDLCVQCDHERWLEEQRAQHPAECGCVLPEQSCAVCVTAAPKAAGDEVPF